MADEVKQAMKVLEKAGYKVSSFRKTVIKRTFEIDVDLNQKFTSVQRKLDLKLRDAINEAIEDWIKKKG